MKVGFELKYARIECTRCGDPYRIYGIACSTCGAAPGPSEVNSQVAKRAKVAMRGLKILDKPTQQDVFGGFHRRFGQELAEVDSCFFSTLAALSAAAKPTPNDQENLALETQLTNLSACRDRLSNYADRRPYIARLSMLRSTIYHVEQMARSYLQAMAAPTPWEAKTHGKEAQRNIDSAGKVLELAAFRIQTAGLLEANGQLRNTFAAVLSALEKLHPGQTLTELEVRGLEQYRQVSGRRGAAGTGITYLALKLVADVHFSPDRFDQVIEGTARLLSERQEELRKQLTNEKVVRDLLAAKQRGLEGHAQATLMMSAGLDEEAMFRQMLRLYWVLYEEVGIPIMAIMLKVGGIERPYESLISEDAGELARRLEANKSLKPLFFGLDKNYRNAASHGHTFHLEEDMAIFELRSYTEKVPVEVVIDAIYSLMESIYAVQLVLDAEISNMGITGHQLQNMGPFHPSDFDWADALIRAMGYSVRQSIFTKSTWKLDFDSDVASVAGLAKALSTLAPSHIEILEICLPTPSGSRQYRMPLAALRDFEMVEGADPLKEVVRLVLDWQENGEAFLSQRRLRCAIASIAILAIKKHDSTSIPLLRRLRDRAELVGDLEAFAAVGKAIRCLRSTTKAKNEFLKYVHPWVESELLALP
ncbi:UNVERIFIED_CONTAM: hypothetical protein ABIE34_001677 [Jeotgalibacillus campisalis]